MGTDILLNYLLNSDYAEGISVLFRWIQLIGARKMIDKGSIAILTHFMRTNELSRLHGFDVIETIPRMSPTLKSENSVDFRAKEDQRALLMQLNLVALRYADILVTENDQTHQLSYTSGIDDRVYTIEEFLEKCAAEHRELDEMMGVILRKVPFGTLSLDDKFFKSFINEYQPYYYEWFRKKANDPVYVAKEKNGCVRALLKLKVEDTIEDYSDIIPKLPPARRLKISSFKVDFTGQKLGERFMRIIFDQALKEKVEEIYVTIFANSAQRKRLIGLIQKWGFVYWGVKDNMEEVYIRVMRKKVQLKEQFGYPYQERESKTSILPIGGNFADLLVPSVELRNDVSDYEPFKNAIKKIVILGPDASHIRQGEKLFFYRKGKTNDDNGIVASGIIDNVYIKFTDENQFLARCKKRTILSTEALHDCWIKYNGHPVVVYFLHNYSFGKGEIDNQKLIEAGIPVNNNSNMIPIEIQSYQFDQIIKGSAYEENIIVD